MAEVISMIRCSYCSVEWCREDTELVCGDCVHDLIVDLAVADIITAVSKLEKEPSETVNKRADLLESVHNKLTKLLERKDGATATT